MCVLLFSLRSNEVIPTTDVMYMTNFEVLVHPTPVGLVICFHPSMFETNWSMSQSSRGVIHFPFNYVCTKGGGGGGPPNPIDPPIPIFFP